jgi:hypothetical protein
MAVARFAAAIRKERLMSVQGGIEFVIRFRGGDFEGWKAAFDEHEPVRVQHGAIGHRISRSVDAPDEFIGVVEFASLGGARGYAEDIRRLDLRRALGMDPHHRSWEEAIYEPLEVEAYRP